jgi:predicted nucleic acid-binding protein
MKLFIDTNIYLKFYHFTSDELEELNKLIVLIDEGEIELLLPKQVINEFRRNREVKIADALKKLKEERLNKTFPVFCKEYKKFQIMNKAISDYENSKKALISQLELAIETYKLKADITIDEIFDKAIFVDITDELIERAKLRFDLGNPPGKNNSYGDALNWESLLIEVNYEEDLFFLSDDKDYFSQIDNKKFNKFLEREWDEIKSSKIFFYKSISDFFKEKYPDIKLATELLKDLTINKLEESGSFQVARKNNTQIFWISEDQDINEILYKWIDEYTNVLEDETLDLFKSKIKRVENFDEDDLPF